MCATSSASPPGQPMSHALLHSASPKNGSPCTEAITGSVQAASESVGQPLPKAQIDSSAPMKPYTLRLCRAQYPLQSIVHRGNNLPDILPPRCVERTPS